MDDPKVCQTAIATVLSSLENIYSRTSQVNAQKKPILIAVSTTGISSKRDIPIAMIPLYHWLLPDPHADKKVMEVLIEKAAAWNVIRGFVIVRPSLLTEGKKLGLSNVRVGWENEDGTGAAIGYTISREDVGGFIFEKVIQNDAGEFRDKKVSLTY